jgi:formate dehydrogenase maturation protein FdhE
VSQIITYLKCDHCGKEYKDIYVSFGHPEKDLVWKWECDSCKHVNEKLIKAWPQKEIDFIALKNLDLNKEITR